MFPAVNVSAGATYPPSRILYAVAAPAANGNNSVIAAPAAGSEIVILNFYIQNTTAVATTAKLLAGASPFFQRLFQTQGNDIFLSYPQGQEVRCGATVGIPNALLLNLSGANAFNIAVGYVIDNLR